MKDQISYSPYTANDLNGISMVSYLSFRATYANIFNPKDLDKTTLDDYIYSNYSYIKDNKLQGFVAKNNSIIIGFVLYGQAAKQPMAPITDEWGEIFALYLSPQFLRQKIGGNLIDKALAELRLNFAKNFVWVIAANKNARNFYVTYGPLLVNWKKEFDFMGVKHPEVAYSLTKDI